MQRIPRQLPRGESTAAAKRQHARAIRRSTTTRVGRACNIGTLQTIQRLWLAGMGGNPRHHACGAAEPPGDDGYLSPTLPKTGFLTPCCGLPRTRTATYIGVAAAWARLTDDVRRVAAGLTGVHGSDDCEGNDGGTAVHGSGCLTLRIRSWYASA